MAADGVTGGASVGVRTTLGGPAQSRPVLSASRIDAALSRAAGVFGVLFGAQTVPVMLAQAPAFAGAWGWVLAGTAVVSVVAVAVSTLFMRFVRNVCGLFALIFLLVMLVWPFLVTDPTVIGTDKPWVWFLVTVATVSAALAYSIRVAAAYTVVLPILYLLVRVTPEGGAAPLGAALLDAVYSIVLGSAALVIVSLLRQTSAAVDLAQAAALDSYAIAARHDARETERVEVDALVHDSVLTTLLAAAASSTPDQARLAQAMATAALERLAEVEGRAPGPASPVPVGQLVRRIRSAIASVGGTTPVHAHALGGRTIPSEVAEAMYSAALQALVNSAQHASSRGLPVSRRIDVTGSGGGCRVVVADDGDGFDPSLVPRERMGIRISIHERMAGVGGSSTVRSAPGAGAAVELNWPAEEVL